MEQELNNRIKYGVFVMDRTVVHIMDSENLKVRAAVETIDHYDEKTCNGTLTGENVQEIIEQVSKWELDDTLEDDLNILCLFRDYLYELDEN